MNIDDYKVLLMALIATLPLASLALIAKYSEWRENRRKEELAKKLHL